ncbi:MAG: phosphoribosyltransferase family protein [Dialister sp.]
MAKRFYPLEVAGCKRKLPVMNISETKAIAAFVILGDVEIVMKTAHELAEKVPKDADYVMTAETKGIPLAAELAKNLGHKTYMVARKSVKAYMENPIWVKDESITTEGKQKLYLSESDVNLIRGKRILLVDDVISTGGSMKALRELAEKAGAEVICQAAILAEGEAIGRDDIIYLAPLPLLEAE